MPALFLLDADDQGFCGTLQILQSDIFGVPLGWDAIAKCCVYSSIELCSISEFSISLRRTAARGVCLFGGTRSPLLPSNISGNSPVLDPTMGSRLAIGFSTDKGKGSFQIDGRQKHFPRDILSTRYSPRSGDVIPQNANRLD